MDIKKMTAAEAGRLVRDRKVSCKELTQLALSGVESCEPEIHAFISFDPEAATRRAESVQKQIDGGEELSLLAGVPMAVKDNICTKEMATTCGSRMLEGFKPPYDAGAVELLEKAGAVLLGKTNMDEFAMGGSTETSYFGATKNPWDRERVPGGSSGGSAAAVASGEVFYALGSDTGGSVRQPCAFCGVSGIKPTYGAVSRYGLIAYASSLDQIGPIARSIEDCAEVLSLISGHDGRDSTSIKAPAVAFEGAFDGDVKGLRIGVPKSYFAEGLSEEVKSSVLEAGALLEQMGAKLVAIDLPAVDYAVPAYYIVACAEASSNLSRYDGIKYGYRSSKGDSLMDVYLNSRSEGFGMEVKRRIMLGSFVLSSGYYDAYYKKGLQAREVIQRGFSEAFESCDMILSPNAPTTAYKLGENIADPLKMYLGDIYTVSVNLAGLPAVTVPCGFDSQSLPIGMQLIGKAFDEYSLVKAAHAFQLETDYHKRQPEGRIARDHEAVSAGAVPDGITFTEVNSAGVALTKSVSVEEAFGQTEPVQQKGGREQ